jgi:hypothetical protein
MANTVRNMHYDFKQKLNKIDSQKNRNFQVPEIDWKINEALNVFIKMIANPKYNQVAGFETSQRSIDSIRPLVKEGFPINATAISATEYAVTLPVDYMMHVASTGQCKKGECIRLIRTSPVQHDDKEDIFHSSSFEWNDLNIKFAGDKLLINSDGTFAIEKVFLTYIKLPKYVHTATDYIGGTYTLPDGTVLTGYQECELPVDTLSEIVDLAVLITTGDLLVNYQLKQAKTQITN